MQMCLTHRGPDDYGEVFAGRTWLGHRRLSIVDIAGGEQPLGSDGGDRWMVCNGEIYNHDEIRAQLPDYDFTSNSDNEVALALVESEGPDALSRLNGMFALVIAGDDGALVAARDPVGIKPLYWVRDGDRAMFASELGAFDPERRPLVEPFPPGHFWTPERGLVAFARIDEPPKTPLPSFDAEQPAPPAVLDALRQVLIEAVEARMMADVPVGVFLSGGLDSSLVGAIAARVAKSRGQRLLSFAVGMPGSPDLTAARSVAEHLEAEHHEATYTAEQARAAVPEVVRVMEAYDPALVRSGVPNYFLAELAAAHCKVVLTGEGADELFAGYGYYHEIDHEPALHDELVRSVAGLHNLNLQRADRVTMAHSLEARVPFLDLEVIRFCLALPAAWKTADADRPEKLVLRRAFEEWLPDEVLWRTKAQFGDGSGAADALTDRVAATVSEAELAHAQRVEDPPPRTREEAAYLRMFREHFGDVDPSRLVGSFAQT
jgi:asparagine synthase (glutamine-hydrolysing)